MQKTLELERMETLVREMRVILFNLQRQKDLFKCNKNCKDFSDAPIACQRYARVVAKLRQNLAMYGFNDLLEWKFRSLRDSHKHRYLYYTNDDDTIRSRSKTDETLNKKEPLKYDYLLPYHDEGGNIRSFLVNGAYFWIDDVRRAMREDDLDSLHSRLDYFRIGDEFYPRKKYILFKNKAYDRTKYATKGNQLIDLSQVYVMKSKWYRSWRDNESYRNTYYLKKEGDESFVHMYHNDSDCLLKITPGYSSFRDNLISSSFITSMFVIGKKRYFNDDINCLKLTRDECMELEFKPTQAHKEVLNQVVKDFIEYEIENAQPPHKHQTIVNDMKCMCDFNIELLNCEGNSIKGNILKELLSNHYINCGDYTDIINAKLKTLREILKKEDEYAERKQSRATRTA